MVYVNISVDNQETKLYIDEWLYNKLTSKWLATIKRDDDFVFCVDGGEGAGKSVFAFQLAKLLDPNFNLDKICMNANQFKKRITEAKKGECIVYDEAFTGLSSKGALTEINKILVEMMMEMRALNLKVIIVLPTFFMLEKYVALFRARCLFHVYRKRGLRGHWMYFGRKKKKLLYLLGKKYLSYKDPRSERKGKFLNIYTINEEEYRKKKDASFKNKDRNERGERFKIQRDILFWYLNRKLGITQDLLTDMFYFFDFELDTSNLSKDLTKIDKKIEEEIKNLPDDTFVLRLVKMINLRNEVTMRETRKKALEERAIAEIEREKRRLAREDKKKKKEAKETVKNLGTEIDKEEKSQKKDAISEFLETK